MTKVLAILGASGHGKVIADLAEELGYEVSFYDDAYPSRKHIEHWLIKGSSADLITLNNGIDVVIAIGDNEIRAKKIRLLQQGSLNLVSLIHPTAVVSQYAQVGLGCVVFANAVINAFATVGLGCIINTGSVIEHDCQLGNFVHVCPNTTLAGGVKIGTKSWVGIGSQVKQFVDIGKNTMVGAGSTVLQSLPDNVTAFGSPCIIKNKKLSF